MANKYSKEGRIQIYVTPESKKLLEAEAKKNFLDFSEYMRQQLYKLINYTPPDKEEK